MPGRWILPPRLDPSLGLIDIAQICNSEDSAILYAKDKRLLPNHNGNRFPCIWTPNCNGEILETTCADNRRNRATVRPVYRCNGCTKKRSQHGGSQLVGGPGNRTWFAMIDRLGRPNSKLPIKFIILLMWCWAKGMSMKMTNAVLSPLVSIGNQILVDWFNYIRQILHNRLSEAQPLGDPGQIIQIDESCMRGRWKYNRGRLLRGNKFPAARNN